MCAFGNMKFRRALFSVYTYSKTCLKRPLSKRPKNGFKDQLSLNAGPKYCKMLHGEHSAIRSTFIKLPFVIKMYVLFILSASFRQVLLYIYQSVRTTAGLYFLT